MPWTIRIHGDSSALDASGNETAPATATTPSNSLDLGVVHREIMTTDTNMIIFGLPRTGAGRTRSFDYLGVTENLVVEGTIVGSRALLESSIGIGLFPAIGTPSSGAAPTLRGLANGIQTGSGPTSRNSVNGNDTAPTVQRNGYDYTSDFYGLLRVIVNSVEITLEEGQPYSVVRYRLNMTVTTKVNT